MSSPIVSYLTWTGEGIETETVVHSVRVLRLSTEPVHPQELFSSLLPHLQHWEGRVRKLICCVFIIFELQTVSDTTNDLRRHSFCLCLKDLSPSKFNSLSTSPFVHSVIFYISQYFFYCVPWPCPLLSLLYKSRHSFQSDFSLVQIRIFSFFLGRNTSCHLLVSSVYYIIRGSGTPSCLESLRVVTLPSSCPHTLLQPSPVWYSKHTISSKLVP